VNEKTPRSHRRAGLHLSPLLVAATLVTVAAPSGCAVKAAANRAEEACARQRDDAIEATSDANDGETRSLRRRIDNAVALFRLHQAVKAQAQLEWAARRLESRPDLFRSRAARIKPALGALRSCVSTATAPALSTVNVRVFRLDGGTLDALGARGGAGVYVRVEGIPVGRTAAGGTLRVSIPSGAVKVTALVPSTAEGVEPVTIEPGASRNVSIGLDADGDVMEETDLAIAEAAAGVLRATTPSFTLKFTDGDRAVPLSSQPEVELLDSSGDVERTLNDMFTIKGGAIAATDVRAVLAAVRPRQAGQTSVRLRVRGVDADGFTHGNVVEFRLEPER
jgi:hypothetical protein